MPTFDEHEGKIVISNFMVAIGCVVWPALFLSIPASELNSSSSWFKYAAVLFWYCIPGHTVYGRRYFYPYLKYLPDRTPPIKEKDNRTYNMTLLRYGSLSIWNWMNFAFFIQGMLAWQWSYTNGPVTTIDWILFITSYPFGVTSGQLFFTSGWYQPLFVLWVAPVFMLVGLAKGWGGDLSQVHNLGQSLAGNLTGSSAAIVV